MVESTSQAVLGSSDQRKVLASLSVFLKSEKIPALHYVGKGPEYRIFSYTNRVSSAIVVVVILLDHKCLPSGLATCKEINP